MSAVGDVSSPPTDSLCFFQHPRAGGAISGRLCFHSG
jgi:hypothetical protein